MVSQRRGRKTASRGWTYGRILLGVACIIGAVAVGAASGPGWAQRDMSPVEVVLLLVGLLVFFLGVTALPHTKAGGARRKPVAPDSMSTDGGVNSVPLPSVDECVAQLAVGFNSRDKPAIVAVLEQRAECGKCHQAFKLDENRSQEDPWAFKFTCPHCGSVNGIQVR